MEGGLVAPITTEQQESKDVTQQVQERLKRADELEVAVKELAEQLQDANSQLGQANVELRNLKALERRKETLDAKEKELESKERELNLRAELNQLKLEGESKRVTDHQKMFELVFRNTQIRRSKLTPVAVDSGSMVQHMNGTDVVVPGGTYVQDHTTTTEETEV